MSTAPLLLLDAGADRQSTRSASSAVVKAARGFHVFRVDGFSLTKTIPGGERISSEEFTVGGHRWRLDLYPNGTDSSNAESDSISLYLVLVRYCRQRSRFGAEYKFSLLDPAGDAAYELPAEKGIFFAGSKSSHDHDGHGGGGYATFIGREELERRSSNHQMLDCLAIRCDVGVTELETLSIGTKHSRSEHDDDSDSDSCYSYDSDSDGSPRRHRCRRRRRQPKLDDRDFVRHCLELLIPES